MLDRSEIGKRGYLEQDFRLVHLKDSLAQRIDYHYHEFDKLVFFLGGKVAYVVEGVTYFLQPWDIAAGAAQHDPPAHHRRRRSLMSGRCFGWEGTGWRRGPTPAKRWTPALTRSRERGLPPAARRRRRGGWPMPAPSSSWRRPCRSQEFGARPHGGYPVPAAADPCEPGLPAGRHAPRRRRTATGWTPRWRRSSAYIAATSGRAIFRVDALAGRFFHQPVLPDAPLQGGHRLHRPPVHRYRSGSCGPGS